MVNFEQCTKLVIPKVKHEDSQNGYIDGYGDLSLGACFCDIHPALEDIYALM